MQVAAATTVSVLMARVRFARNGDMLYTLRTAKERHCWVWGERMDGNYSA